MFERNAILCVFMVAVAGCASADTLVWNGVNSYGTNWGGFYTSPYYAIDTSKSPNLPLTLFCLDFNDSIAPPIDWQANINTLTSSNVTNDAQFGGNYGNPNTTAPPFVFHGDGTYSDPSTTDSYTRYLEVAWLFTNIEAAMAKGDTTTMVASQVAAWELFVEPSHLSELTGKITATTGNWTFENYAPASPVTTTGTFQQALDTALLDAQAAVNGGFTGDGWSMVTGDETWVNQSNGNVPVQEFLTPTAHMPEPSAIVLVGTVMAFVAIGVRRRRKRVA